MTTPKSESTYGQVNEILSNRMNRLLAEVVDNLRQLQLFYVPLNDGLKLAPPRLSPEENLLEADMMAADREDLLRKSEAQFLEQLNQMGLDNSQYILARHKGLQILKAIFTGSLFTNSPLPDPIVTAALVVQTIQQQTNVLQNSCEVEDVDFSADGVAPSGDGDGRTEQQRISAELEWEFYHPDEEDELVLAAPAAKSSADEGEYANQSGFKPG